MYSLESAFIDCPYCGERIETLIDSSVAQQEYIEDCTVCCRPITLTVDCIAEPISIEVRREDDC